MFNDIQRCLSENFHVNLFLIWLFNSLLATYETLTSISFKIRGSLTLKRAEMWICVPFPYPDCLLYWTHSQTTWKLQPIDIWKDNSSWLDSFAMKVVALRFDRPETQYSPHSPSDIHRGLGKDVSLLTSCQVLETRRSNRNTTSHCFRCLQCQMRSENIIPSSAHAEAWSISPKQHNVCPLWTIHTTYDKGGVLRFMIGN